jgi:chromosome segregation ATPase
MSVSEASLIQKENELTSAIRQKDKAIAELEDKFKNMKDEFSATTTGYATELKKAKDAQRIAEERLFKADDAFERRKSKGSMEDIEVVNRRLSVTELEAANTKQMLETDLAKMKERLVKEESLVLSLRTERNNLQETLAAKSAEIVALQNASKSHSDVDRGADPNDRRLLSKVEALEHDLAVASEQAAALKAQGELKDDDIEDLNDQIESLQSKVESLTEALESEKSKNISLAQSLAELNSKVTEVEFGKIALETEKREALERLAAAESAGVETKKKLDAVQTELDNRLEAINKAQALAEKLHKEISELTASRDEINRNAKAQLLKAEEYVNYQTAKIAKLEAKESDSAEKVKALSGEKEALTTRLTSFETEKIQLESLLKASESLVWDAIIKVYLFFLSNFTVPAGENIEYGERESSTQNRSTRNFASG